MNKLIIAIVFIIVVVLVGVGGFAIGKSGNGDTQKLVDAKDMMKDQSADIKAMGDIMNTASTTMQVSGTKYKDDALASSGKDLAAVADKYMKADAARTTKDSSMK